MTDLTAPTADDLGQLQGRPVIRFVGDTGRHEADTFAWDNLTKWQQNAVLRCHLRLTEIAKVEMHESKPRSGAARFLPKIDRMRMNNAVLIDGRRGSGKTIVLFTLLRYWIANSRFNHLLPQVEETLKTKIRAALGSLRKAGQRREEDGDHRVQIVPIGPVDLQYLSPATQIIPLIAGAFHDVVQGLREIRGAVAGQQEPPPWTSLPGDATLIADRWRDFVTAASAWEVNSSQRQSRVDPEEYVIEVSEMETQRAKLQGKFRSFADALHHDYKTTFSGQSDPLFVLCIDDADMKPSVSVRLLEALRVLYHPRVAFLLTGNSELFENMLTDSFFAGLRAPLLRLDLTGDQPDEMNDRSFALRLAREVYGKVVPTSHRIEVPRIPSGERHLILEKVVARVRTESPRSLLDTLTSTQDVDDGGTLNDPLGNYPLQYYLRNDKYTLNALPEQLRDMWSLRDFIRDYIERAAANVADEADVPEADRTTTISHHSLPIRVVQKLWIDALQDSLVTRGVLDLLRNAIRFETRPHFRFFVDNTPVQKNTLSVPLVNAPLPDGTTMSLRRIVGYEMYAVSNGVKALLSESAEGAIILATNMAADYETGDFVAASLSPDEFDNPFVTMGIPISEAEGILDVVWPLPDWDAFIDFHIFSERWQSTVLPLREKLRVASTKDSEVEKLAQRFIGLVLTMIPDRLNTRQDHILSWPDLTGELVSLAFTSPVPDGEQQRVTSRNLLNRRWARSRAILLAAPESRLPEEAARQFLEYFVQAFHMMFHGRDEADKQTEWKNLQRDVELARAARLDRSYVHSGKERGTTLEQRARETRRDLRDRILAGMGDGQHPWYQTFPRQPRS